MSLERPLRVLVVDDHVALRRGLATLIDGESPRMRCIGTVSTPLEALSHARELQPDVVLLDVDLGGEDGLALIPGLQCSAPCAVIVLSSMLDAGIAERARELGAITSLHKTAPAGELIACVASARPAHRSTSP